MGDMDLKGAGTANSPTYSATIRRVGDIDLEYETMAVMTLGDTHDYGLLGIELLKHMRTEISGSPRSKTLTLEDTHLP